MSRKTTRSAKPAPEGPRLPVSVGAAISAAEDVQLEAHARRLGRTRSSLIREAIAQWLERQK